MNSDTSYEISVKFDLRGHLLKLAKGNARLDIGKHSFSNRVVDEWNMLNEEIIESSPLSAFIRKLNNHLCYSNGYM